MIIPVNRRWHLGFGWVDRYQHDGAHNIYGVREYWSTNVHGTLGHYVLGVCFGRFGGPYVGIMRR